MRVENDVDEDMGRSEDVKWGFDVCRIDLCRRISNAMLAARDNEEGIPGTTIESV
jgi:hypothetical protein